MPMTVTGRSRRFGVYVGMCAVLATTVYVVGRPYSTNCKSSPVITQPICRFIGNRNAVTSIAFLADGAHVVSGGKDGSLRLWGMNEAQEINCLYPCGENVYISALAAHPTRNLVVCYSECERIALIDPIGGETLKSINIKAQQCRFTSFVSDTTECVAVCGGEAFTMFSDFPMERYSVVAASDWDCDRKGGFLVSGDRLGIVRVLSLHPIRPLSEFRPGTPTMEITHIALFPDSDLCLLVGSGNEIAVIDLQNRTEVWRRIIPGPSISSVGVSPDGRWFAVGRYRSTLFSINKATVDVFAATSGEKVGELRAHRFPISSIAFSADSTTLATAETSPPNRGSEWNYGRENVVYCWKLPI